MAKHAEKDKLSLFFKTCALVLVKQIQTKNSAVEALLGHIKHTGNVIYHLS